ncbi:MAG: HEPN domain-containing protein [Acidobacteria bacterium]|nr:HEPN domain-containing protein [Acidobacteriota bacterium]
MTKTQKSLLARGQRTLDAAKLLRERGYLEEALSRSYYAMFYAARALLAGEGLSFSKHSAVIAAFGQHFAKPGRVPAEYHYHLRSAQDFRLSGDYDLEYTAGQEEVQEQIARAERFLALAQELTG